MIEVLFVKWRNNKEWRKTIMMPCAPWVGLIVYLDMDIQNDEGFQISLVTYDSEDCLFMCIEAEEDDRDLLNNKTDPAEYGWECTYSNG